MRALSNFRSTTTLQDQINRLFNETFERPGQESNLTAWAPAVDIYENEHELVVKADLPDVDAKDLDIRVENNTLTVKGERKFEKEEKEENFHRVERRYGTFYRAFTVPNTIDPESIKAEYDAGVLHLELQKRPETKPKQIKVNVGSERPSETKGGSKAA